MPVIDLEVLDDAGTLTYGATFELVKGLLPHRRWSADSKPTKDDVEGYIASVSAVLGISVDPLPADEGVAGRLVALARRAVVLGAAAHAEAAAAPERAKPNDVSSYATWLWARYEEALAEAKAFAEDVTPGDLPPGVVDLDADPAWYFPEPAAFAARGI